jgi:hypothetical protein
MNNKSNMEHPMEAITRFGPQEFTDPQPPQFYDCGCCGHYHPVNWDGDCRDDENRFAADELDERYGSDWEEVSQPGDFDSYIERIEDEHGITVTDPERYRERYEQGCPAYAAISMFDDMAEDPAQLSLSL